MGVRKLLTDKGVFYTVFYPVIDQFITPAFSSAEQLASHAIKKLQGNTESKTSWLDAAESATHIYDLRRQTIRQALSYLAELKSGRSLTDNQACQLYEFAQFLEHTVKIDFLADPTTAHQVEHWFTQLGICKNYPIHYDWQDILDNIRCVTYYNAWSKRQYSFCDDLETGKARPEQNKFIGRYLSQLCIIANIVGPRKDSPEKIVDRFYNKEMEVTGSNNPDTVITHALRQKRRGRKPSMSFRGERNPRKALELALRTLK